MSGIEWLAPRPDPEIINRGAPLKLHAVRLEDNQKPDGETAAVCGIWPNWGFETGLDGGVRCKRCTRILSKVCFLGPAGTAPRSGAAKNAPLTW